MTPTEFRNAIKMYRSIMTPTQRKKIYRVGYKPILYPLGAEREYARMIRKYQVDFVQFTMDRLNTYLPRMVTKSRIDTRYDDLNDDIEQLMSELQEELAVIYGATLVPSSTLFRELSSMAEKIFARYKVQFEKKIEVLAGIPLDTSSDWFPEVSKMWANENYRLIKSLSTDYVTKLNTLLTNGLQSGWSMEEFATEIQKLSDKITGYRARLIARDQVGKLNSYIAERQSRNIGMEFYIWRTAQDERVRGNPLGKFPKAIPSHYIMDDLFCSWNSIDAYSPDSGKTWISRTALMEHNHPGRPISCRCIPIPVWNIYAKDIDDEIKE